ncbi:MAG: NADH-quinone oxidoreductase subunit L [Verrucomicrobiota bacterium]|nr:NADH-quinone oxidoreductase subunit L [Verrucomicrobiota bacterium]
MGSELYAYGLLAIPLFSATLIAFCFRRSGGIAASVSIGAAALILATALHLIFKVDNFEYNASWIEIGSFSVDFGFLIDDLAKLMLFVVAFVGFLVHVFSYGYMKEDPDPGRFFGGLSIFMFSMLGLVMASGLVTLFIFWELVGFSSYMLIGFYLDKPSAAAASKKAFIVNRVGDFGFLIGIVMVFSHFGTFSLSSLSGIFHGDGTLLESASVTAIGLLLFCGTVGKSGQLPLHVWLPDAMEGPTPVSALIHAATMVAAGVFLLCRIGFLMTADALQVITWVGVSTALVAGFTAIAQRDIKKILAYSTVSQLGYMVAAFGLGSLVAQSGGASHGYAVVSGGAAAAMFHLTTHAFFKALLFLGSGSVIHACHHEQDIFRMGGLAKRMPITFWTFTVALLALIGTPFITAGFYSKDAILALAYQQSTSAFFCLVLGAVLTAFYMIRLWKIAFLGSPKSESAEHAKENGLVMTVPLCLLAIGSVFGGFVWAYPEALKPIIEAGESIAHGEHHTTVAIFSIVAWAIGLVTAWFLYQGGAEKDPLESGMKPLDRIFKEKFYFDRAYDWYVAKVQQPVAMTLHFMEQIALSGLIIRGMAGVAGLIGIGLRSLHVGNLHQYLYWFIGGLALFWALAVGIF